MLYYLRVNEIEAPHKRHMWHVYPASTTGPCIFAWDPSVMLEHWWASTVRADTRVPGSHGPCLALRQRGLNNPADPPGTPYNAYNWRNGWGLGATDEGPPGAGSGHHLGWRTGIEHVQAWESFFMCRGELLAVDTRHLTCIPTHVPIYVWYMLMHGLVSHANSIDAAFNGSFVH